MTAEGSPRTIYGRARAAGDAQTARLVAGELGARAAVEGLLDHPRAFVRREAKKTLAKLPA